MNIPVEKCSSCAACANVCARDAITMRLDNEGFYRPTINPAKCVSCGACKRACPWSKDVINPSNSSTEPQTIAAYALSESIRMNSSSGGIFSILAEKVLDDGGVVVGVAQLDKIHFGHIVVENKNDLAKLRGSKYVQADVGMIYKEVRSLLKNGRNVLFSGTPCQVAALYSVLGKNIYTNLTTVDIVCHGAPSVKVFEKYIKKLETEFSSTIETTVFRDKSTGWKRYSLSHKFNNGQKKNIPSNVSKYMQLFRKRICQNDSCTNCHYRKLPRIADITLGDYWGIRNIHPEMDDNKGTSAVLLNTNLGAKLFNSVTSQLKICDSFLDKAIAGNPCIIQSSTPHPRRDEFFTDLDRMPFDKLFKKYCPKPPMRKRINNKIRLVLEKIKRKYLK